MKKIVLTGGPGGGKTELKKHLLAMLRERGVNVLAVPEMPTIAFNMGIAVEELANTSISWAFQETITRLQKLLENQCEVLLELRRRPDHRGPDILLLDRAVLDQQAYMPKANFILLLRTIYYDRVIPHQSDHALMQRLLASYGLVINMVTAADGAEEHYNRENNVARSETPEHARKMQLETQAAYAEHSNKIIVPNKINGRRINFREKLQIATAVVLEFLNLPR